MKASIWIFLFALNISLIAQSSINSGTINLNGNLSFQIQSDPDSEHDWYLLSLSPNVGYFIIDNLSINLSLQYSSQSYDIYRLTDLGIGPSTTYYFNLKKIKPFVSIGYYYMEGRFNYDGRSDVQYRGAQMLYSCGIDFFITENVAIESFVCYKNVLYNKQYYAHTTSINEEDNSIINRNTFLFGVGINIFL